MTVFHDRFKDFRGEIRELLDAKPSVDVPYLECKTRKMMGEDLVYSLRKRKLLMDSHD